MGSFFAEGEGFEPPVPCGTAVFKTAVIDHSTILPIYHAYHAFVVCGAKVNKSLEFRAES